MCQKPFNTFGFNKVLGLKVSGQGKLEFESDFSKMFVKQLQIHDFAKMMLPLQRDYRTCQNVFKNK